MSRTVTVGLDGSPESLAAAEWATREAKLCDLPVKLLNVWEPVPEPMAQAPLLGAETLAHWSESIPRETAEGLTSRHPGVNITAEQVPGRASEVLAAAKDAALLVLGSRGLSGLGGFLVGSIGQAVIAHTETPVILVRAGHQATDEHEPDASGTPSTATPFRPVVLGLDTDGPDDTVITFAFEEAARRGAAVKVVAGWNLPPYYVYSLAAGVDPHDGVARERAAALSDALRDWRQKYPHVEVIEESRTGSPANHLVDASRDASLVVVGRRIRRSPLGAHIGSVTHAVLHHATAPVGVVAHG